MSDENHSNGSAICPLSKEFVKELRIAVRDINTARESILDVHEDLRYLKDVSESLHDLRSNFVNALLGKQIVPLDVHKSLLEGQRESYKGIIKLQTIVFGLIIIFLLGMKYLAPHWFAG